MINISPERFSPWYKLTLVYMEMKEISDFNLPEYHLPLIKIKCKLWHFVAIGLEPSLSQIVWQENPPILGPAGQLREGETAAKHLIQISARKSEFSKRFATRTSFSFSIQPATKNKKDGAGVYKVKTAEKYKIYLSDPDKTCASEQWRHKLDTNVTVKWH